MELILKRRAHLEEQISKDFELLKQLEDERRLVSDPQEKARLKRHIDQLNEEIKSRSSELTAYQTAPGRTDNSEVDVIQKEINVKALTLFESHYALSSEANAPLPAFEKNIFELLPPPLSSPYFAGRRLILEEINSFGESVHIVVITGITGFGKTALLKQIASSFNPSSVFWHKFNAGLALLDDILARLGRFLDTAFRSNFFEKALRIPETSVQDKIELIIKGLNEKESFLFFDDVQLTQGNAEVENFFNLLKERLGRGVIFVSSSSQPDFIKLADVATKNLRLIHLEGFDENETKEFLSKKESKSAKAG